MNNKDSLFHGDILIVEDNKPDLKFMSEILKKEGYRVRAAGDGELALRSVQAKLPDLILLDINLPGMGGVEVCRHLKNEPETKNIPIIFISAMGKTNLKVKALEAGGTDYVTKPLEISEILARINTHLNLYKLQQRLRTQSEELRVEIEKRKNTEAELKKHRNELEELVKERTAEMKQREEKYSNLYESSLDGIAESNLDGAILSCNPAYEKMTGYTFEELKKLKYQDITPSKWAEIDKKHVKQALSQGFSDDYEKERIHKDGTIFPISIRIWLRKNKSGEPMSLWGIVRDISKRKHAENSLLASEKKYRSILESMRDATYICSPDFHIEYMNPRMVSRIGRDATGEFCYKAIYNCDEKCSWCIFDQIKHSEHISYELENPMDNKVYTISNSPIKNSDGQISKLTICRDITENRAMEEQLRQAHKMESIGILAGGVAHDFNNLLYLIIGNTEMALEDIPEWNPVHESIEEIKSASLRAAGIVKQLLNFSRKTDQELKPVGAVGIIKDVLKFLRSTIPSTVKIITNLPDAEVQMLGNSIQINQIMMNLCANASKFMQDTGGTLKIDVGTVILNEEDCKKYTNLCPGNHIKISVNDSGPGIAPDIIDKIFDPYFTTKKFGAGYGMGLTVVHGNIKNHDGFISVDSKLGEGTTFNILFPVFDELSEPNIEVKEEAFCGTERILFVDDEESIANMACKILKRLGYQVEMRLNPIEVLELFKSTPNSFDMVITDMTMPQMTGAKLAERLKAIRSDLPVIICTGHSAVIDEEKAKQLGIDGFVMKPVSKLKMAKTIRKILDK